MGRLRSDTHSTAAMESTRRPSLWAGSLRRDHIRLEDLPSDTIHEGHQHNASRSGPSSASRQNSFAWPFHGRNASEVPSTSRSSRFTLRTWQPRSFFRPHDDAASIDRSIVPDYVVNFMRGETPETLARKREQSKWGQHGVEVTPRRGTYASYPVEFGNYASPETEARDLNTRSSWSRRSGLRRHITGWRGGVIFNSLVSCVILLVGIICLILVITKTKLLSGESAIFSGDCAKANHINTGVHLVINVFGVALVSGANYVFQVLSSPTRREVTVAHENKHWLDIGIPSIRNFTHISGFRGTVAILVLLGAVATQVIYNAVIFTTQNVVNYDVLSVTQSFLDHAPFTINPETNEGELSRSDILFLQDAASQAGDLTNLTSVSCLQEFSGVFQPSFDAILLITDSVSTTSSLISTSKPGTLLTTFTSNNNNDIIASDGSLVQYCLAHPSAPQTCSVNLSGSILGVVVLLNLTTVISMAVILGRSTFEPLVTVGDAIRSFLRNPDPTTANACLLTKTDVKEGSWASSESQYFVPANRWWFQTPSPPRWMLTVIFWTLITAPTAVALGLMVSTNLDNPLTFFGVATSRLTFRPPIPLDTPQAALLTALPQLLLAALYLVVNSHLTVYFLSHEFSQFALGPQPLRVSSNPAGSQTTSLFLTLPRPVSWALLAWFAAMGFALSQAVFPGVITFQTPSSTPVTPSTGPKALSGDDIVAISFSTQALLTLASLLLLLALAIVFLGFRRAPAASFASGEGKGNPLVLRGGSCSAVISAKCHNHDIVPEDQSPRAGGGGDLWLRPVAWGVVEEGTGMRPGRCGFSADGMGCLDAGRNYV